MKSFQRLIQTWSGRRKGNGSKPGSITALLAAGDQANADRRWEEAETAYSAVLEQDPSLGAIWIQYGHSLKEQGKMQPAEDAYRSAIDLDENEADAWLQLGHVLKLQGARDEAADAYEAAYRRQPLRESADEIVALGRALPVGSVVIDQAKTPVEEEPASGRTMVELLASINRAAAGVGLAGAPYRSVPSFLRTVRLSPRVLNLFDHDFYANDQSAARDTLLDEEGVPDRGACLVHFVARGIDALRPIREEYRFDADFYRQSYLGPRPFNAGNAYRNWLNDGIAHERWPNRTLYVRSLLGSAASDASGLDLSMFGAFRDLDVEQVAWTQVFNEFIDDGAADPDFALQVTPENAELLVLIADRLAVRGEQEKALFVYERVLLVLPDLEPALYHYGDALLRKNCHLEAASVFGGLVRRPVPGIWAFINLSVCQERLGTPLEALRTLRRAIEAFPGDQGLRRRFDAVAQQFLTRSWKLAVAQGRVGRLEAGQEQLGASHDEVSCLNRTESALPARFVRVVAIVGNTFLAQCRFYRLDQKVEQLELAGFEVELFDYQKDLARFRQTIHRFQATIFYRVPAYQEVMQAIENARSLGLATFYEIDDPIFDPALYPPPIDSYEKQVSRDEYIGLALGVPLFRKAMALCDHAIASTPSLARSMAEVPRPDGTPRQVFLHRNALGEAHLGLANVVRHQDPGDKVVIFYGSGTRAHKSDFVELVEPALVETVRRHKDRVSIVLAGYVALSDRLQEIRNNVVLIEPTWDVERYWTTLSVADINIAVLKPDPLTDTKSEIKWLEAAMLGIPSVVSNTQTYRELLRPGEDALICGNVSEWTTALDRLVRDPDLRRRIGRSAHDKAMRDYAPSAMAENLSRMIRSVSPPSPSTRPLVLVVNVYYPPQAIGGATRVVHDNVRECQKQYGSEFEFAVFTTIDGGLEPYNLASFVQDGVRVTGISTPDRPDIDHVVADGAMGRAFGAFLDEMQPALVHFHCVQRLTVSVLLAARDRGIPYLITVHDGWWISDRQFLLDDESGKIELYDYGNPMKQLANAGSDSFARMMRLKPALESAEAVLAVSISFAELYERCGVARTRAVPNGVSNIEPMPRIPSPDGRVRLGFVGGLSRHKGYDLLKHVVKSGRFGNLSLLLVDHSLNPGTVREEVWGQTVVTIQAKTPQKAVTGLYAGLDVLLAPSIWPESFGLVTREALLCGCWVVASDRGAIGEDVVEGRNGFVVDVSEPSGLARVLKMMDADPKRFTVSPELRPAVRSSSEQADDLAAVYREIAGHIDASAREVGPVSSRMRTNPPFRQRQTG